MEVEDDESLSRRHSLASASSESTPRLSFRVAHRRHGRVLHQRSGADSDTAGTASFLSVHELVRLIRSEIRCLWDSMGVASPSLRFALATLAPFGLTISRDWDEIFEMGHSYYSSNREESTRANRRPSAAASSSGSSSMLSSSSSSKPTHHHDHDHDRPYHHHRSKKRNSARSSKRQTSPRVIEMEVVESRSKKDGRGYVSPTMPPSVLRTSMDLDANPGLSISDGIRLSSDRVEESRRESIEDESCSPRDRYAPSPSTVDHDDENLAYMTPRDSVGNIRDHYPDVLESHPPRGNPLDSPRFYAPNPLTGAIMPDDLESIVSGVAGGEFRPFESDQIHSRTRVHHDMTQNHARNALSAEQRVSSSVTRHSVHPVPNIFSSQTIDNGKPKATEDSEFPENDLEDLEHANIPQRLRTTASDRRSVDGYAGNEHNEIDPVLLLHGPFPVAPLQSPPERSARGLIHFDGHTYLNHLELLRSLLFDSLQRIRTYREMKSSDGFPFASLWFWRYLLSFFFPPFVLVVYFSHRSARCAVQHTDSWDKIIHIPVGKRHPAGFSIVWSLIALFALCGIYAIGIYSVYLYVLNFAHFHPTKSTCTAANSCGLYWLEAFDWIVWYFILAILLSLHLSSGKIIWDKSRVEFLHRTDIAMASAQMSLCTSIPRSALTDDGMNNVDVYELHAYRFAIRRLYFNALRLLSSGKMNVIFPVSNFWRNVTASIFCLLYSFLPGLFRRQHGFSFFPSTNIAIHDAFFALHWYLSKLFLMVPCVVMVISISGYLRDRVRRARLLTSTLIPSLAEEKLIWKFISTVFNLPISVKHSLIDLPDSRSELHRFDPIDVNEEDHELFESTGYRSRQDSERHHRPNLSKSVTYTACEYILGHPADDYRVDVSNMRNRQLQRLQDEVLGRRISDIDFLYELAEGNGSIREWMRSDVRFLTRLDAFERERQMTRAVIEADALHDSSLARHAIAEARQVFTSSRDVEYDIRARYGLPNIPFFHRSEEVRLWQILHGFVSNYMKPEISFLERIVSMIAILAVLLLVTGFTMFFSQRDGLSMLDVVCITITMSAITYSVYVFRIIALVNDYTLAQIIELEREEMNNERRLSQLSERLASLQARRSGVRSSGYLTSEETFYQNELARLSAELEESYQDKVRMGHSLRSLLGTVRDRNLSNLLIFGMMITRSTLTKVVVFFAAAAWAVGLAVISNQISLGN